MKSPAKSNPRVAAAYKAYLAKLRSDAYLMTIGWLTDAAELDTLEAFHISVVREADKLFGSDDSLAEQFVRESVRESSLPEMWFDFFEGEFAWENFVNQFELEAHSEAERIEFVIGFFEGLVSWWDSAEVACV